MGDWVIVRVARGLEWCVLKCQRLADAGFDWIEERMRRMEQG